MNKDSIQLTIHAICVYPIKSCGPIVMDQRNTSYPFTKEGFKYDRKWLIIDSKTKQKIVQSKYPKLALIKPSLTKTHLILDVNGKKCQMRIDDDSDSNHEVARILTEFLGTDCKLVRNTTNSPDIYPFLAVFKESIRSLNERITNKKNEIKYDYLRFRPNFLLSGMEAWNEENIQILQYGQSKFLCKPNFWGDHCLKVTTHDYSDATLDANDEPRVTLRKWKHSLFGLGIATKAGNENGAFTVGTKINVVGAKVRPGSIRAKL